MLSQSFAGKVVLVTGGAHRIGRCIVEILHQRGASVVVHYRGRAEEARLLVAGLNAQRRNSALALGADLCAIDALPGLIARILNAFGRLDALVNNASSFYRTPLDEITVTDWDDLVGSNFKAPLFLTQAAAPALRHTAGAVVNITDIHAERPLPGYALYCAAKAALLGLTRALALELAPDVRVNAVAPGAILWPEDAQFDAAERAAIIRHAPLQRVGAPEDIARTVAFLLAEANYITGQVVNVDGGRTIPL